MSLPRSQADKVGNTATDCPDEVINELQEEIKQLRKELSVQEKEHLLQKVENKRLRKEHSRLRVMLEVVMDSRLIDAALKEK